MSSDLLSGSQGSEDNTTQSQHMLVAEIMVSGMNNESLVLLWSQQFPSHQSEILNYLSNLTLVKSTQS